MPEVVLLSALHEIGTFNWRHALAWRQLSALWGIPIRHCFSNCLPNAEKGVAFSTALTDGECQELSVLKHCCRTRSAIAIFLHRTRVILNGESDGVRVEPQELHEPRSVFRQVLHVKSNHPFTAGLPGRVEVYGAGLVVTPLRVGPGTQVLVSLDQIPIIAYQTPYLFVGADPWQFGVPSVPMLYKVLSNWLCHEVGYKHRVPEPYAAIRLDDLPTTAETMRTSVPGHGLDKAASRMIRKLRRFGGRTAAKFTLMYSSHFREANGNLTKISAVMPRSLREMRLGVKQGVFEVGSHGMVHLRNSADPVNSDPREFLDLDASQTAKHFDASDNEIVRLFGERPQCFVAPAWGYQPGVTKEVAAERYPIIVDSSQHVESGVCTIFSEIRQGSRYLNMVETFRSGDRMLTYGNADFWKCYAAAGIPIHYMQHIDTNWHILSNFLKSKAGSSSEASQTSVQSTLLRAAENPHCPRYFRIFCAAVLSVLNCCTEPASWKLLWVMVTRSSLYTFVRAMRSAGYRFVTLSELGTITMSYPKSRHKDQVSLTA